MIPSLLLFDDRIARGWAPFALTRPISELRYGTLTLRERTEAALSLSCSGILAGAGLMGFQEGDSPPVLAPETIPATNTRIFALSRLVVSEPLADGWEGDREATLVVDGSPVGWILAPGSPSPPPEAFRDPTEWKGPAYRIEISGARILDHPWDLLRDHAERLLLDLTGGWVAVEPATGLPEGISRFGRHPLLIGAGVSLEPGVVLDLREGPIALGDGVQVRAFTRLEGPLSIGRNSIVLGGSFTRISAGEECRLRGEVEESLFLGHANKAHDGFIGHAIIGRWVNLGALTTNSDLKNNYGPVRVPSRTGSVDTGMTKVGAFLGDHVKTAIGTMLNTGTVVGAGSNLFGAETVSGWIDPFSWGHGESATVHQFERFLDTARIAMGRRGVRLSAGMAEMLRRGWMETWSGEPAPDRGSPAGGDGETPR